MLTGKEKAVIFSPLLLFLLYVFFLIGHEERSFFLRWIDGSFGLFAALVACNLLRRSLAGEEPPPEDDEDAGENE